MPPKEWSDLELQIAGALNTGKARISDLKGPLHPLFKPERWRFYNKPDYDTLLPSMHLASNLINVGMPYIASFLPIEQYEKVKNGPYNEIHLKDPVSVGDIKKAREFLEVLSENVTWELNADMFHTMSAWGMNILTSQRQPWHHENWDEIQDHDRKAQEEKNPSPLRRVTIGVAAQYIEYLTSTRNDSEEHIRAIWHAAITMIHEIGHFIWNCRFENIASPDGEPYVGDICLSELGTSFISWLFDGHTPNTIATDKLSNPFLRPLIWRKEKTLGDLEKVGFQNRPHYITYWSMSTNYLETMLAQKFWIQIGDPRDFNFSQKARVRIAPVLITGVPKPATAFIRDWEFVQGVPVWRVEGRDRSPRPDTLRSLTKAEKKLAQLEMAEAEEDQLENLRMAGLEDPQWMKNRARINDGVIMPDIEVDDVEMDGGYRPGMRGRPAPPPPFENPLNIEIRFWSLPENHPIGLMDKSESYNAYERWKYGLDAPLDGHTREDVQAVMETISEKNLSNRFTRAQALEYLSLRRLGGFPIPTPKWKQEQKLNVIEDFFILGRIEFYLRDEILRHYESLPSLTIDEKIFTCYSYGRLESIVSDHTLAYPHIKSVYMAIPESDRADNAFSQISDEKERMEAMISYWYKNKQQEYFEALTTSLGTSERVLTAMWSLARSDHSDPLRSTPSWTPDDMQGFLKKHNLPIWGDHLVWMERYYAFEYERKYGHPRNRPLLKSLRDRWRHPGEEMYVFHVDPRQTSVGAIKNALYTHGHFPADCTLSLRLFNGGPNTLKDSDPLLIALEEKGELKTILICEIDEPLPKSLMEHANKEKTTPKPKLWNQPQASHRLTTIQRKEEVIHARYRAEQIPSLNTNLTLRERYTHILASAILLEQSMGLDHTPSNFRERGGMDASTLLVKIEDYEDLLEKRLRGGKSTRAEMLDLIVEEEGRKKRRCHARDFVGALKRRNIGLGTRETLGNWEEDVFAGWKGNPEVGRSAKVKKSTKSQGSGIPRVQVISSDEEADADIDEADLVEVDVVGYGETTTDEDGNVETPEGAEGEEKVFGDNEEILLNWSSGDGAGDEEEEDYDY